MSYIYVLVVSIFIYIRAKLFEEKNNRVITIAPVRISAIPHYLEIFVGAQVTGSGGVCNVVYNLNDELNIDDVSYKEEIFLRVSLVKNLFYLLFKLLKFNIVTIKKIESKNLKDFADMDMSRHVNSTIRRLIYGGYIDSSKSELLKEQLFQDCLSIYNSSFECVSKSDLIFMSHGIYSLWGPIFDLSKFHKKKCFINGSLPYYGNGFHLVKGPFQINTPLKLKNHINENQKNIAKLIIENRLTHNNSDQKSFKVKSNNEEEIYHLNKFKSKFKNTISIYPNCLFDGNIDERDSIFNGLVTCINETISNLHDFGIIVRLHPAEATLWSNFQPLKNEINHHKNVYIVASEAEVNSHDIANMSDACVVYDGIIAVELAYLGHRVIMPSKSAYSCCPGIISPKSLEEFYSAVKENTINTIPTKDKVAEWISNTYLNTRLSFSGYISDGQPIKINVLKIISNVSSFLNFYKKL